MTTTSNIARWVTDRAATDPGLPAIKQGDTVLSYGDLDARQRPLRDRAGRPRRTPPATGWR